MKTSQIIVFVSVVVLLYSLANYYIFIRGYQALPPLKPWRISYTVLFVLLAASFILGRIGMFVLPENMAGILVRVSSFWLAFMFYFLLVILFLDIVRMLDHFTGFLPDFISSNREKTKQIVFFISLISISLLVLGGHINALHPRHKKLQISIHKKVEQRNQLQIAMISDLHLGYSIRRNYLAKIVSEINTADPDIVFLVGDMIDEDIKPVLKHKMAREFVKLKAPLGVIGVSGNHEYIGNISKTISLLEENGVRILQDSSIKIDNSFYIIGRKDHDGNRYSGSNRKSIDELLNDVDNKLPIIMLDHQPYELAEKAKAGIDLSLHGHTHHGQLWPLNLITKAIYKLSYGYLKIDDSHFYTSSGVGGWGPRVRIGNRPEIVFIDLDFD
jgi:predicted MPP superfamily phosphohydrolase